MHDFNIWQLTNAAAVLFRDVIYLLAPVSKDEEKTLTRRYQGLPFLKSEANRYIFWTQVTFKRLEIKIFILGSRTGDVFSEIQEFLLDEIVHKCIFVHWEMVLKVSKSWKHFLKF